jgi:hypothetical protein
MAANSSPAEGWELACGDPEAAGDGEGLLWVGAGETSCVGEGPGASLGLIADEDLGEEVGLQAATIRINARTLPLMGTRTTACCGSYG